MIVFHHSSIVAETKSMEIDWQVNRKWENQAQIIEDALDIFGVS